VLAAARGDDERALACFDEVLSLEPDHPGARLNVAMALQRRHRFVEALAHYEACREALADSPDLYFGLGLCLQELGRLDEAFAVYRQFLKLAPQAYAQVLKNLTSASSGKFWLHPSSLRKELGL
jgi:tetratricopeptide (TPR) repeat protein